MKVDIRTEDLWLVALVLARGGRLVSLHVGRVNGGRRAASFLVAGRGLRRLERAYARGTVEANVAELKRQMVHVKDVLFARLREEERRGAGVRDQGRDRAGQAVS